MRTNPAGASVYVDKQPIGTSPAASSFLYYGTREIEVVGDGYRTEKVLRKFSPPWYQLPPLDFISETLWPWEIRDERIVDITLVPNQAPASEVLQARADELRLQASQGLATPLPPTLNQNIAPGTTPTTRPIDPTFDAGAQPIVAPALPPKKHTWYPGKILGEMLLPGGLPPQRTPETGMMQGGGYRPEIPE